MELLFLAITLLVWALPLRTLGTQNVQIGVYYESLSPNSRQFIQHQLFPTFQKVGKIMDITLVPFGNAQEHKYGDKWVFYCQHGQTERDGNMIQACAISISQDPNVFMPLIHCHENCGPLMANTLKRFNIGPPIISSNLCVTRTKDLSQSPAMSSSL